MKRHVTIEDICKTICAGEAGYIDESKSDDEDLYMVYTVHACEDGTLVQHSEDCDKTFEDYLWFRDYKNVCCKVLFGRSREEMDDDDDEDLSDIGYCDICCALEDLDRDDFRELCEDLADQINDWLDSLDANEEDEEED